jgi:hypothetical protein
MTATARRPESGGTMLKYSHPDLAVLLHYWPSMVFLPLILLGVVALATVTHCWDERDEQARGGGPPKES